MIKERDRLLRKICVKKSFFETDSARDFSLSEEVSKIARSRDFRVIGTKSWFQTVKNIDKAQNIFIDSDFFKREEELLAKSREFYILDSN